LREQHYNELKCLLDHRTSHCIEGITSPHAPQTQTQKASAPHAPQTQRQKASYRPTLHRLRHRRHHSAPRSTDSDTEGIIALHAPQTQTLKSVQEKAVGIPRPVGMEVTLQSVPFKMSLVRHHDMQTYGGTATCNNRITIRRAVSLRSMSFEMRVCGSVCLSYYSTS
jgi:hypothetical protein